MEINVQCLCGNCFRERNSPDSPCTACGYDPTVEKGRHPMALRPGSILNGKYIIGRVLGQGGFGITYLALDYTLNIRVAVKEFFPESVVTRQPGTAAALVSPEMEETFTEGAHSFLDEARVLAKFQGNLNIVGVREFFEENRTAYFVMDYVEGTSFKSYIVKHGGKVSWQETAKILIPVMDALEAVHLSGILHRDVTPDNIFLTQNGGVKLLDFGAARYASGGREQPLDVFLKAGYAPIEQYGNHGRQGPYTDVYSLAATFYAAITGFLPPEAEEREKQDTLTAPSAQGIIIPSELEFALLRGLAVQPEQRFQSMAEFRTFIIQAVTQTTPEPDAPIAQPIQQKFARTNGGEAPPGPQMKNENAATEKSTRRSLKVSGPVAKSIAVACLVLLVITGGFLGSRWVRLMSNPVPTYTPAYSSTAASSPSSAPSASVELTKVRLFTTEPQAGEYAVKSLEKLGIAVEASNISAQELAAVAASAAAELGPIILFGNAMTSEEAEVQGWMPLCPSNWDEVFYATGFEQSTLFLKTFEALTSEVHVKDEEYWYVSSQEFCGTYTGYLKDEKLDGWGIMNYGDGRVYAGYWSNNCWNGRGTLTWPDGDRLVCDFVDDVFCGTGIYYWADGRRYEGEFADNERNGQGTIYYTDGTSKSGIWKDGQLIS